MNSKIEEAEKSLKDKKPYEYFHFGPFILDAPERKFKRKFLDKAEYSEWLDNDIRRFG